MSKRVVLFRRRIWKLHVDVRGVPREQLHVLVHGSRVSVTTSGECVCAVDATYDLPAAVDATKSRARLEDGVLLLELRAAKRAGPRRALEIRCCPSAAWKFQFRERAAAALTALWNRLRDGMRPPRSVLYGLGNLEH